MLLESLTINKLLNIEATTRLDHMYDKDLNVSCDENRLLENQEAHRVMSQSSKENMFRRI